jgi:Ca2+-transporting ATPase
MITGDHTATAAAIGHELGIEGQALRGAELDQMTDQEFQERVKDIGVFGRVAPEHKVRLVETLQAGGHVVAMTGDGVNDAPALKRADIGVAMGITGTEVSKQAANMILTDDNFATIVEAVRLGRAIWDNLMKYLRFQLSALAAWVLLYVGAAIFDIADGAPLAPLQVIWIKFAVVVPPAIGLGYDTPSAGLMGRKPRPRSEGILNRNLLLRFGLLGLVMAVTTLVLLVLGPDDAAAQQASVSGTMAFVTFSFALLFVALSSRSETKSVFDRDSLSNPRLLRLLALPAMLTLLVTVLGFLQEWFDTVALTSGQWLVSLAIASIVLWVEEARKLISRRGVTQAAAVDRPLPQIVQAGALAAGDEEEQV